MISSLTMDNLLHHCNSPSSLNSINNNNALTPPPPQQMNSVNSTTSVTTPNSPNSMFMSLNSNIKTIDSSIPISYSSNNNNNNNGHLKRKYENLQEHPLNSYTNGINKVASISSTDEFEDEEANLIENQLMRSSNENLMRPNSQKSSNEDSINGGQQNNNVEGFLEAQKVFQRMTSQLSGNAFQLNNISPFLAAFHQQNFHQQFFKNFHLASASNDNAKKANIIHDGAGSPRLSLASSSRPNSPERVFLEGEEEFDNSCNLSGIYQPEDLSLAGERKNENDESVGASVPSNWSYEEQFKQLYELSEDSKRKEWLDDWLSFMHRIGKPVTRIPIMAKQVLDLYELYRLVVQHGGLVEIINKKLWREITKGLNLPNSITSAAFTLRTQYQKYLYDYECDHENLSCLSDLTAAIEGNRREGRRTNTCDLSGPTTTSTTGPSNLNGGMNNPHTSMNQSVDNDTMAAAAAAAIFPYQLMGPIGAIFGKHLNLKDEAINEFNSLNQQSQNLGLDASQMRQFEILQKAAEAFTNGCRSEMALEAQEQASASTRSRNSSSSSFNSNRNYSSEAKRPKLDNVIKNPTTLSKKLPNSVEEEKLPKNLPSTHFKLTSKRTANGEKSMVVSMELNGTMYQGVLFATNPTMEKNTSKDVVGNFASNDATNSLKTPSTA